LPLHNFGDPYYWVENIGWHTSDQKSSPPRVILHDFPLWFHTKITSELQLRKEQGFIFEDVCRSIFENYKNKISDLFSISYQAKIHHGYWQEDCTEIDVVVSDEETKTVIWGSCKLSFSQQDYFNSMSHVVSFFNNRGYGLHPWYNYRHIFLFLSMECNADQRKNFIGSVTPINDMLAGNRKLLVEMITKKLSNYANEGKSFKMSPGAPDKLFYITSASVLNFNDLKNIL